MPDSEPTDPHLDSGLESETPSPPKLSVDQICLGNPRTPVVDTHPSVPAIYTAAVYQCESTEIADQILGGTTPGFAYQRDAHPNGVRLAEKCRQLHAADAAAVTSSGMSALSAIVLGLLKAGNHILVSNQLYGRSSVLLEQQLPRLGISFDTFDPNQLDQVAPLHRQGQTKMAFAETISNPVIRIIDIPRLVSLGRQLNFEVAIDNTFATPFHCRPLELGAHWVWESYSKMLNGHSDVMMGLVCGRKKNWHLVQKAISTWGLSSAPFECYLAERGLTTFGLRIRASIENARNAANFFSHHPGVKRVHYGGLPNHPDRHLVAKVLNANPSSLPKDGEIAAAGNVVSVELNGNSSPEETHSQSVATFLEDSGIEYFPSLGECNTTLSHPCSSSHRHLSAAERQQLGISANTIRLCFGIEPWEILLPKLEQGLSRIAN